MKKYFLMLVALGSLSLFSCGDKTNNESSVASDAAVSQTEQTAETGEAPQPTGDLDKDAKACCDYIVSLIDNVDPTDQGAGEKIEQEIQQLGDAFDKYYKEKGQTAEWEAAGEKYKETIETKLAEFSEAINTATDAIEQAADETE